MRIKMKNGSSGRIKWSFYPSSGETAIVIMDDITEESLMVPTVNLYDPTPPPCADDEIWLKTWSENKGIDKLLEAEGICTLTGEVWPAGYTLAVKAKLTPKAIADRDQQMPEIERTMQKEIKAKSIASWRETKSHIEG